MIKIKEGMILSNEPGYYEKNKFGIRIENLLYVKKVKHKLYFENLTLAPIEKELINFKLLYPKVLFPGKTQYEKTIKSD